MIHTQHNSFFIITPLAFTDEAIMEFEEKWPLLQKLFSEQEKPKIKKEVGGFTLQLPIEIGLILNLYLKIPTRILLRLTEFKCRDFPKLYNRVKKFNWLPFLLGPEIAIKVSCHQSRLLHTERIKESVLKAIQDYFIGQPAKKKWQELSKNVASPTLFFRLDNDLCTISIDTTGERLDKRGQKTKVGVAPLRENLAMPLLHLLIENTPDPLEEITLIDPMMGSGTFLSEAYSYFAPAIKRTYSFMHFPFIISHHLLFLQRITKLPPLKENPSLPFQSLWGLEEDVKMVEIAREQLHDSIKIFHQSSLTPPPVSLPEKVIMIVNPPYGERIPLPVDGKIYYKQLIENFIKIYNPKRLGIIIPKHFADCKEMKSINPHIFLKRPFKNGGIECFFYVIKNNDIDP